MYNLPFPLPFGCLTSQTFLCRSTKPRAPYCTPSATEGGRGEGDDNGAEGTILPQPADTPARLQGFNGQCQTGPREFGSSGTSGG